MAGATLVSAVASDKATIASLFIGFTFPLQRRTWNMTHKGRCSTLDLLDNFVLKLNSVQRISSSRKECLQNNPAPGAAPSISDLGVVAKAEPSALQASSHLTRRTG
jgi:hypothetical protein